MARFRTALKDALAARVRESTRRGLGRTPPLLEAAGRGPMVVTGGRRFTSYLSNDYLGLAADAGWQATVAGCFAKHAVSSSGSRLAGGHTRVARDAEQATAAYFGYDECVFLPSGYQGNLALVTGLLQAGQPVLVDRRIHASTGHALMGTGATILPYAHADLDHLGRRLARLEGDGTGVQPVVLAESLYSMDGTVADPRAWATCKSAHGFFLIMDEAHALGCLGPGGRGVMAARPGTADAALGTLGKGCGFFGAFALLPAGFTTLLEHLASPVMHSTELPPAHAAAMLALVDLLPRLDGARERLAANAALLRRLLAERGVPARGQAHIVSVPVGDEARCLRLREGLENRGVLALAARFPTVPWGKSLLRFGVTALHTEAMIAATAAALAALWEKERPAPEQARG